MAASTMSVKATGTCWEAQLREGTFGWLRGVDLNHRPLGYEPNELPDCSTPLFYSSINSLACGARRRLRVLWDRSPRYRSVLPGLCRLCRSGNLPGGRLCICRCRFRICE